MSAISLAGLLPEFGKLTPAVAAQGSRNGWRRRRATAYDGWLYPTDPVRQPAAERLHEAWRSWKMTRRPCSGKAEALA